MNLQSSPPEKTIPTADAEAMQHPVSAEKKGCIFYKLIGKSIIQQKELAIPKKFGRKFGDTLSDVVTLIDCNLNKWKIGLRRVNHRLWFHHGWPKFVEDHSIYAGSFLIFKYEGNSNFAVNIYELVESEMKSPFDNAGPSSEPSQPEQIEVDADVLTETHPNSKWKRMLISELDSCVNKKKLRMDVHDKKASFLQSSSESMPKSTPSTIVDDIPLERREQEVNSAQHSVLDTEDYANDFMDILNEDIDINVPVPQCFVPGCSKDNNGFVECMPEKTPSDSVGWLPFEKTNDSEDYANDFMEKLNKDVYAETSNRVDAQHEANNFNTGPSSEPARAEQIEVTSIRSPQFKDIYQTMTLPSPSKTPIVKPFAEFSAEKTPSVTSDSIVRPVLEMRDKPAPRIGTRVDSDELIETQPNSEWKRRLISELDACHDKNKPSVEVHDKKGSFLKCKRIPRVATDEERKRVVLAAKNFKSDLPFCQIMMRPSHVYSRFDCNFPAEFSKKYLKDIQGVIELRDPNGRKWLVRCSYKDRRGSSSVTTGWRGFVVENNLDDGDICIFELVQRDDIMLKVYIFRAANPEVVRASSESMPKTAQHSGMGTEDYANDFMEKMNKDVYAETGIRVDGQHEANNFNTGPSSEPAQAEQIEVTSIRSTQSKDIYQTVMLPSPSKTPTSKPFAEFSAEKTYSVTANSIVRPVLEMRDKPAPRIGTRVDLDELIETQPNSEWKRRLISELDACHDNKNPGMEVHDKKTSFLKWKRRPRSVTDEERKRVVLAAKKFKSDLPFCRVMMRVSHVYYRFAFYFPAEFSKKHLKDIQGLIELHDPSGRKWLVRCNYKDKRGSSRVTTGWRDFVFENNLDDGDICIFELVQSDDIVLKVYIFRAATILREEIVRDSGESMPKGTNSVFVDNTASERREQEVNPAQNSGTGQEDYASDFIQNEKIDITVPQYSAPGCSKDNNCIAETVGWFPFEMRDKPVTDEEKRLAVHEENTQDCNVYSTLKHQLESLLKPEPEILRRPIWHPSRRPKPSSDV